MDNCSYFIKGKALFGSFPTQDSVKELEEHGVKRFVNLTNDDEKRIKPYTTSYYYYSYPIMDRSIPTNNLHFCRFLNKLINLLKNEDGKIYIHCKGGHGRSGLVVACLLCMYYEIDTEVSLEMTKFFHSQRPVLKEKWKKIGSPQTLKQKNFVKFLFKPLYYYKALKNHHTSGFSNFSLHTICIKDIGEFCSSEAAYNYYKNNDSTYCLKQLNVKSPFISRKLSNIYEHSKEWKNNRIKIMKKILLLKFEQHPDFRKNLLNTSFREIIFNDKNDYFWGKGENNTGANNLGKLLTEIRNSHYY